MTLYFAYGSNLNKRQMGQRCPGARVVRKLTLADHLLVFRGCADVIPSPGNSVPGAVWKLTAQCEAALDTYEGVEHGLYRKEYLTIAPFKFHGEVHDQILIYVMNSDGIFPPSIGYLNSIRDGYRDFGLPLKPLYAAVEAAHEHKAPSHIERRRHARKGRPELAPRPSEVRQPPTKEKLSAQRVAARAADEASRALKQPDLFRRSMIVYGD